MWADRGTRGHAAVEVMSSAGLEDDPNLKSAVDMCIAYVRSLLNSIPGKTQTLREVKLKVLDQYGHADLVLLCEDGTAHLLDWKFAHNLYKADAPQFWAYSLGVFDGWPVKSVEVHVLHPWLNSISKQNFTRDGDYLTLLGKVRRIIARATACDPKDFTLNSGCTYCARAGTCPALAATAATIATRYDSQFQLPDGSLHGSEIRDPEILGRLLELAPIIEKATAGWRNAALNLWQQDGVPIPGFSLMERNGSRKITSPIVAYQLFLDKGGKAEDYARVADVPMGELEDLFASLAPKGSKGAAKQELNDLLLDRDAISVGKSSFFLKRNKQ